MARPEPSPYDADVAREFLGMIAKESDRGRIVLCVEWLAEALGHLLRNSFIAELSEKSANELLHGPTAPLSHVTHRARLAFAIGLIAKEEYADLKTLVELRNRAAHFISGRSFTLTDDATIDTLSSLHTSRSLWKPGAWTGKKPAEVSLALLGSAVSHLMFAIEGRGERRPRMTWPPPKNSG